MTNSNDEVDEGSKAMKRNSQLANAHKKFRTIASKPKISSSTISQLPVLVGTLEQDRIGVWTVQELSDTTEIRPRKVEVELEALEAISYVRRVPP